MSHMDFKAELVLPSVIIDVPELEKMIAQKKMVHTAMFAGAGVIFLILSVLIFVELTSEPKEIVNVEAVETTEAEAVKLTVKLVPEQVSGAVVEVDGEVISGNPPYVYLTPSEDYHSIKVTAPGYESITKDVRLSEAEVLTFGLTSLAPPPPVEMAEADLGTDEQFDTESFGENSDDLIEEIVEPEAVADAAPDRKTRDAAGGNNGGRRGGKGKVSQIKRGSQNAAGATAAAAAPTAKPAVAATVASNASPVEAPQRARDGGQYGLGPAPAAAAGGPAKASLIINAPMGMNSRVSVSVDGQMRGYLPVLLKIEPGLHELMFVYEGHRSFQMVKLGSGQIARIIPNL